MKKYFLIAIIVLFSLSACVPSFLGGAAEPTATASDAEVVDFAATIDAEASTQAVQTLGVLATPTIEDAAPMTEEPTATATESLAPTEDTTVLSSETPESTIATETATLDVTETAITPDSTEAATETVTPSSTSTPEATGTVAPTATSVYPSATSPVAINLPPENLVPRFRIEVKNNTKGPVYISLQGTSEGGYKPIVEYDIPGHAKVRYRVPEGFYTIVVYVGKEPMVAYTGIHKNDSLSILINRNELILKK